MTGLALYRGLARLIQERSKVKARDAAFQRERAAIGSRENGKDDGTAYQDWRACDTLPYRKNRECQSMQERVPALRWTGLRQASPGVHEVQLDLGAAERHLTAASKGGLRVGDWLWQKTI